MPPMSLTISISFCSVSSPSFMLWARPPMASMGSMTSPVAFAASYAAGAYCRITSFNPAISPVVHVTPSSISVFVSPTMFSTSARNARAASLPLRWVTAVIVPMAAVSSSIPTWACAATGATVPKPSASFSMLVAYLLSISLAPSSTLVRASMLPLY